MIHNPAYLANIPISPKAHLFDRVFPPGRPALKDPGVPIPAPGSILYHGPLAPPARASPAARSPASPHQPS